MPACVRLRVIDGPNAGQELVFAQRSTCVVGRADECTLRIPEGASLSMRVSRRHCQFDIDPPGVRVRDLGSLNGTYVNGEAIGRRQSGQAPGEGSREGLADRSLADGDTVRLGDTVILVGVTVPAPTAAPTCSVCGREVADLTGVRHGAVMCESCRTDAPSPVVVAHSAAEELFAIRGYQPVRELGRGGQGVVYLARNEASGAEVALKVLLAHVAVETQAAYGFNREVASVAALRHPHVVRFLESGADRGTYYFTSEYLAGGNVLNVMRERRRTLTVEEAVPIALQILDALAYAHTAPIPGKRPLESFGAPGGLGIPARGLVHRDVKPSNILLAEAGSTRLAKLGDFGLAKAFDLAGLSGHTMAGSVGGTLGYMPRVQVLNYRYVTPEVDVWACAASLYFMLTGSTPRAFPPRDDAVSVVLKTLPVPIRERDPHIPPRLAAVIDEALVDKPRIVYTSAPQLSQALKDAL